MIGRSPMTRRRSQCSLVVQKEVLVMSEHPVLPDGGTAFSRLLAILVLGVTLNVVQVSADMTTYPGAGVSQTIVTTGEIEWVAGLVRADGRIECFVPNAVVCSLSTATRIEQMAAIQQSCRKKKDLPTAGIKQLEDMATEVQSFVQANFRSVSTELTGLVRFTVKAEKDGAQSRLSGFTFELVSVPAGGLANAGCWSLVGPQGEGGELKVALMGRRVKDECLSRAVAWSTAGLGFGERELAHTDIPDGRLSPAIGRTDGAEPSPVAAGTASTIHAGPQGGPPPIDDLVLQFLNANTVVVVKPSAKSLMSLGLKCAFARVCYEASMASIYTRNEVPLYGSVNPGDNTPLYAGDEVASYLEARGGRFSANEAYSDTMTAAMMPYFVVYASPQHSISLSGLMELMDASSLVEQVFAGSKKVKEGMLVEDVRFYASGFREANGGMGTGRYEISGWVPDVVLERVLGHKP